jgi:ATP-dependent Clp protease protease subunit
MVKYQKGGEESGEKKSLSDLGIIDVTGAIEDATSEKVCEKILEMNVAAQVEHIQMIINSPGGSCSAGFAIIDLMEWSRIPVHTTGLGRIASMGLLIFMAGEKGRRVLTPRTSILSHRFSTVAWGSHSQLVAQRREEDLMHRRIIEHYLTYSSVKNEKELTEKLLRDADTWLTPEEAVACGIADAVEKTQRRSAPTITSPTGQVPVPADPLACMASLSADG